jgi:predicted TIM-barrel fold metal-dependent hydrolase
MTFTRTLDDGSIWYPAITTDSHLREPRDLYDRLPKRLKERGPVIESTPEGDRIMMNGKLVRWIGIEAQEDVLPENRNFKGVRYEIGRKGQLDPEARKYDLAIDGVQGEVIYAFNWWMDKPDKEVVYEMIKIYNDWLGEAFEDVWDRSCPVPMLPSWDPNLSVEELYRLHENGHRAVQVAAPYCGDVKYGYSSPEYDVLWAAAASLNKPICMHIGSGASSARYRGPGATLHDFMDTFLDSADIVRDFIGAGIFERHPTLNLVATEGGIGWAPWFLIMMDRMWEEFGNYFYPPLPQTPSFYFHRNVLITWQDDVPGLRNLDLLGQSVAWGSDYPHAEGTFPESRASIRKQVADLPLDTQIALVAGNSARVFGFDLEVLADKYGPGSAHEKKYGAHDGGGNRPEDLEPIAVG